MGWERQELCLSPGGVARTAALGEKRAKAELPGVLATSTWK